MSIPYLRQIALTLFSMRDGSRFWFWFHPDLKPKLAIERLDKDGEQAFKSVMSSVAKRADRGQRGQRGLLVARDDGTLAFVGAKVDLSFLQSLAEFVASKSDKHPALQVFVDAVAAEHPVPFRRDALQSVDIQSLKWHSAPRLWDAIRNPGPGQVASVLSSLRPGVSAWVRLRLTTDPSDLPILLNPVSRDPLMRVLRRQASTLQTSVPEMSGFAAIDDAGVVQVTSTSSHYTYLKPLADWVRAHGSQHPALRVLCGARLIHASRSGEVMGVYTDAEVWSGMSHHPVAGTLTDSSRQLETLPVGGQLWAFAAAGDTPFIALYTAEDDADGKGFAQETQRLEARFKGSQTVTGVVSRPTKDTMIFTTSGLYSRVVGLTLARIIETHGEQLPGLLRLRQAKVVGLHEGLIKRISYVEQFLYTLEQGQVLSDMRISQHLLFWLLPRDREGAPLLLVGTDKKALLTAAKRWSIGSTGQVFRGRITRDADGYTLHAKSDLAALEDALGQWIALTGDSHSSLTGAKFKD